jgi:hypothetical protein
VVQFKLQRGNGIPPDLTLRQADANRVLTALDSVEGLEDAKVLQHVAQFRETLTTLASGKEEHELSSERVATLSNLKANYDRLSHLANGVTWADAEKALRANPAEIDKLAKLLKERPNSDLTVTGRENGEIMFEEVAADCPGIKNISYDKEGQNLAESRHETCNGNAVDVAASFGAKPTARHRYEALRGKVPGLDQRTWAWILTDAVTRKTGFALFGGNGFVSRYDASNHRGDRGVRLSLGVKEAA